MIKKRTSSDKLLLLIKGFAMGAVNKIPGVSGGIIALLCDFYVELIYSIQKINLISFKLLFSGRWKSFYNYINAEFLIYLFGGSIISFFSMSLLLDYLIINYSNYLWSSFFGMVLASIYFIFPLVRKWRLNTYMFYLIGTLIGLGISLAEPINGNDNLYFVFFCGMISVSGMTLPGISGSFLLLLLGNYELLLVESVNALFFSIKEFIIGDFGFLNNKERIRLIQIMIVFMFGSITGLVFFVNVLNFLLKKFYSITISLIIGFISGSIMCLWPWRILSNDNKLKFYFPSEINKETVLMLICITLGAGLVYVLEKYGKKNKI
ncbi:MAG: DUF368 domain-containing protein [Flavobacteriaceae bacterium]|mgnify:CR=1 FL=1|nr:DUF368 domain-containing protein [Flavobacteriaceae bacterium]